MAQKRHVPTFRVACDDYLIEDESGENYAPHAGEWVKFYRRMPARLVRALTRAAALQADISEADAAEALRDTLEELVPRLSRAIHSWNWIDPFSENGAALETDEAALWELDLSELFYLAGKLFERTQAPLA